MVFILQERFGWTDEYIDSLCFERFGRKVEIILKRQREKEESEYKWKVVELLTTARSVSFALQADKDLPLTKAEQKKGPNDSQIKKTKREILKFMEGWQKALSHPWYFEEYNGFVHRFDKPQVEVVRSTRRLESREEINDMVERMKADLRQINETQGNQALSA